MSMTPPAEIIFEVTEAAEGGSDARALGYSIFTQGDDWDDLKAMVKDAVLCHFGDGGEPRVVRLHFARTKPSLVRWTLAEDFEGMGSVAAPIMAVLRPKKAWHGRPC